MNFSVSKGGAILAHIEASSFLKAAARFAAGRRYRFCDMGQLDLSERCQAGIVHISVDEIGECVLNSEGYIGEAGLHTHSP